MNDQHTLINEAREEAQQAQQTERNVPRTPRNRHLRRVLSDCTCGRPRARCRITWYGFHQYVGRHRTG